MSGKSDILVLGATGYTGSLIIRYLSAHPQRSRFSLALGARSPKKLSALAEKLNLSEPSVKLVQVDVTDEADLERAVRSTRVVINAVGPYWLWGTPVVRSCVRNGVHYVDLTGEKHWINKIIREYDYFATQTGAIIVPSCGFDSVPSDAATYLANKTLKSLGPSTNGEYLDMDTSTSAFSFRGGISGGTIASAMAAIEAVPDKVAAPSYGVPPAPFRFLYNLSIPGMKPLIGGFFIMAPGNAALVHRSQALFELHAKSVQSSTPASDVVPRKEALLGCYGSKFKYTEFQVMSSVTSVVVYTAVLAFGVALLLVRPIRYLVKKVLPQPGQGPSEESMQKGFFKVTNLTTSTSSPPVQVKTLIKGRGDPGYLLASVMIAESALCFLLPAVSESKNAVHDKPRDNLHALPPLARKGGILTPMTAFGDVLLQRLEETGRFEFSSSIISDNITEGRKNI